MSRILSTLRVSYLILALSVLSMLGCGRVEGGPAVTKPCPAGKETAWCPVKATGFARDPMAFNVARCESRPVVRVCFTPPKLPSDPTISSVARLFGLGAMRVLERSWNAGQNTWNYTMELEEDCAITRDNPWPKRLAIAGNAYEDGDQSIVVSEDAKVAVSSIDLTLAPRPVDEDPNTFHAIRRRTGRNVGCDGCMTNKCASQVAACTSPVCACWEAAGCNSGSGNCTASCGSLSTDPAAIALSACRAGNCYIECAGESSEAPACAVPNVTATCDESGSPEGTPCDTYSTCASCMCGIVDPKDETTYCLP